MVSGERRLQASPSPHPAHAQSELTHVTRGGQEAVVVSMVGLMRKHGELNLRLEVERKTERNQN